MIIEVDVMRKSMVAATRMNMVNVGCTKLVPAEVNSRMSRTIR